MKNAKIKRKLKAMSLLDISSQFSDYLDTVTGTDIKEGVAAVRKSMPADKTDCIIRLANVSSPKVTVVIPTYNTADYVVQCLESIKTQSLNELEVIVVDDASSDDTLNKIFSQALQDERITVITLGKQSGSPGRARNIGVALASAPYVAFVDSDDWIEANMLKSLFEASQSNNSDIVFLSGFINHLDGEKTTRYYKKSHLNSEGELSGFHESFMLWDKLWKREFLTKHNLQVGHTSASEELLFILKAYHLASKSNVAIGNYGYNYRRMNPTSITRNVRKNVYPAYEFEAWHQVDVWVRNLPLDDTYRNIISLRKILSFHYAISIVNSEYRQRFCAEVATYLSDVFTDKIFALAMTLGYSEQISSLQKSFSQTAQKSDLESKPGNIIYGPDWSSSNPYQRLMYHSIRKTYGIHATGFSPKQLTKDYLYSKRSGAQILHLHWLHAFYEASSQESASDFIEKIRYAKELGFTILWTAHNLMPHETSPSNEENHVLVRTAIIKLADHIHVHDNRAGVALQERFYVPSEKLFIAPHGLYEKSLTYSDRLRTHVRSVLNLEAKRFTVLLAGRIRSYKGIERAINIFTQGKLNLLEKATLVIAGYPDDEDIDAKLVRAAKEFAHIRYIRGEISDTELEAIFLASDVCLLPYEKSATSGLAFLSVSYQTPMITSKLPAFSDFVDRGMAISAATDGEIEQAIFYVSKAHADGTLQNLFSAVTEEGIKDLSWDSIVSLPNFRKVFGSQPGLEKK